MVFIPVGFKKVVLLKIGIKKNKESGKEWEQPPSACPKVTLKKKVSTELNLAQPLRDQVWSCVPRGHKTRGTSSFTTQSSRSSYFHLFLFPRHFHHLRFHGEGARTATGGPLGWAGLCGPGAGTGGFY